MVVQRAWTYPSGASNLIETGCAALLGKSYFRNLDQPSGGHKGALAEEAIADDLVHGRV